jgi:hypothetical protein
MHIWHAGFGCTASLQIACAAELHGTLLRLALHPKSDGQMHCLFMNKTLVAALAGDSPA